jgi:predicted aldo/keto reductase-like oxidoreductase
MGTLDHVKEALAAAATFKPLTSQEREELNAKAARITGGVCSECVAKTCEAVCPTSVPISRLMSASQEMSRLGYDNRRQGDMYAALEHDFMDCDLCSECEKACSHRFEIMKDLEAFDKRYREARARDVVLFQDKYR